MWVVDATYRSWRLLKLLSLRKMTAITMTVTTSSEYDMYPAVLRLKSQLNAVMKVCLQAQRQKGRVRVKGTIVAWSI